MASRNGSTLDGESSNAVLHSGQSLGLPAAFPRNQRPQPRAGSRFSNYRGQRPSASNNSASAYGYDDVPGFAGDNSGKVALRTTALTDFDLALAAKSTLIPTAGEFIPRSQADPSLKKKPPPKKDYRPSVFKSQDGRYSEPDVGQDHAGRPGRGFDTNQRRSYMEDAKTQDRQRHLSEAAAFLTSMSNPEPTQVASRSTTGFPPSSQQFYGKGAKFRGEGTHQYPGEGAKFRGEATHQYPGEGAKFRGEATHQYPGEGAKFRGEATHQYPGEGAKFRGEGTQHYAGEGAKFRGDGNFNGNREMGSNGYAGRNQARYDNSSRNRDQDSYDSYGQSHQLYEGGRGKGGNLVLPRGPKHAKQESGNARWMPTGQQTGGSDSNRSSPKREQKKTFHANKDDITNQRERLCEQLTRGTLECLVCCEVIRQQEAVWSCTQCFHVLHLRCVKKWAFTSKADNGWRCPACQFVTAKVPADYFCFCGQTCDPEWNRQDVPHSCGEMCNKSRAPRPDLAPCTHRCNILCHPGPCPICQAQVKRYCGCGATSQTVKCGGDAVLLCQGVCGKMLNCKEHKCEKVCHMGDCQTCELEVQQVCFCGKTSRQVACTEETFSVLTFACDSVCGKRMACGHHDCHLPCHAGDCAECQLTPDNIKTCPCGKQVLTTERTSCLESVPTCGQLCGKKLTCGQPSSPHECEGVCHEGACPPCPLSTLVRCRCGNMDKEIPCTELTSKADDARCTKKCTKKRTCGKHKCNQLCCILADHICPVICHHHLSCGRHRCELLCHRGHCKPCSRFGWEELFCECGTTVTLPPVPCGQRPPECNSPCSRQHPCDHPVSHNCHSYPSCPPCTVFTSKLCYGNHMLRNNVPCYQTEISCGLACGQDMPCGRHKCILPCHQGPCVKPGVRCVQPCTTPRVLCGHNCMTACHEGNCPDTPCREMVKVTCDCGHRSVNRPCADNAKEYQRIATSLLASKMADMQLGHTVDIADLASGANSKKLSLKTLECNEECKVIERNRRLAIGLQIVNPDLSAKLTPRYSEFLRGWAKKDPHFCQLIHTKLTELVQLAKQSKQKSRSYSFEPMNRDKRHFVHELCEHFGCQSEAYDPEPKRNVVATAVRDKAWLPSMSLMEVIQRENGVRKIPKPVMNFSTSSTTLVTSTAPNTTWRSVLAPPAVLPTTTPTPLPRPAEQTIDYFDFTS